MEKDMIIENGILKKYNGNAPDVVIPEGVTEIGENVFKNCSFLRTVVIPESVTVINTAAFYNCASLQSIIIPNSVMEIGWGAFYFCPLVTVVCREDSYMHRYCEVYGLSFIFDYMYRAFNGLIPPESKIVASPFAAEEEKPFAFVSYRHADRKSVFDVIKNLYEAGFRLWYDEGLNIGEKYDEVIEKHVKECAAFLLFVTENSKNSKYIIENEIPWAKETKKPIIKVFLQKGENIEIGAYDNVSNVSPDVSSIEEELIKKGVTKGEIRKAKGLSVLVDLTNRNESLEKLNSIPDGFAYCIYSDAISDEVRTVLSNLKDRGCRLYDSKVNGENMEKLENSARIIVFIDKNVVSNKHLVDILNEPKYAQKIIHCHFDEIDFNGPFSELYKTQGIRFDTGNTDDLYVKLNNALIEAGIADTDTIFEFEYIKKKNGILLTRYKGKATSIKVESSYGGLPVIGIGDSTFKNCKTIEEIILPECIGVIAAFAFSGCASLKKVIIPENVKKIGMSAFEGCTLLNFVALPKKIKKISARTFRRCSSLSSITLPSNIKEIGREAFFGCTSLKSINIPAKVKKINKAVFRLCSNLENVTIPEGVTQICGSIFDGEGAFQNCKSLKTVTIPKSVKKIGAGAFSYCFALNSVTILGKKTRIGITAFCSTDDPTIYCPAHSKAWKYCKKENLRAKEISHKKNDS